MSRLFLLVADLSQFEPFVCFCFEIIDGWLVRICLVLLLIHFYFDLLIWSLIKLLFSHQSKKQIMKLIFPINKPLERF